VKLAKLVFVDRSNLHSQTHPEHPHSSTETNPIHQAQHRSGADTTCYLCHGSGIEPGSNPSEKCSHCGGSGIGASFSHRF
jgi:hypothetical protein